MAEVDQTRNLNPSPQAVVAMIIWGKEYSEQGGGSMDFWDQLDKHRKNRCKSVVKEIHRRGVEKGKEEVLGMIEDMMPDGIDINFEEDNYASGKRDALQALEGKLTKKGE